MREFRDTVPQLVVLGAKGSGKTYIYKQLLSRKTWESFSYGVEPAGEKDRERTLILPLVCSLNIKMLLSMVRECIESRTVEKVIDLVTDEQICELYDLAPVKENENVSHSTDYYFHYRLAELSGNIVFVNFIDTYYDIIDELKTRSSKQKNRIAQINEEHKRILEAIQKRDSEKARQLMHYHLQKVKEHALANENPEAKGETSL